MARRVKKQQGKTIVLLGAGYVARAMVAPLRARGLSIVTTHRSPRAFREDAASQQIVFDGRTPPPALRRALAKADYLISSIPPEKNGCDPVINALPDLAALMPHLKWAAYLSATSLYGDRSGKWAFEDEAPTPSLARGRRRAEAELSWLETGLPVHIFRLAGIYGPGRSPFEKLRSSEARAVIKPGHVVNRIHIDDIVSALLASLDAPNPQRIYNLADGAPCPPQDVLDFAAGLIGAPKAPRVGLNDESVSDMARSFYEDSKSVSNARLRNELGWTPKYPNYKDGLAQILGAEL